MDRYNSYCNSDIYWIGEIPEHWTIRKLGHVSYMKGRIGWQGLKQAEFTQNLDDPFLITGMNFKDGRIRWDEVYHISNERYNEAPEIQLKECDLLITKDGTIGKLLYVDKIPYPYKASLNSHLLVLRPFQSEYFPKFMYYQLSGKHFKFYIDLVKTGTTFFGISQESMNKCKLVFPPFSEQTQIARFLDHKTSQIDRLIAKKEELLKLLAEKRTALITKAVTKGLDPNVEMKDSGIDWLGEIPKHWEISKIGYDYDVQLGKMIQPEPKNESDEFLPYLRSANIQWTKPDMSSIKSMWFSPKDKEKYNLIKGDLLISEGGDVGRSCIWNHDLEMYFQNAINRVRSSGKSDIEYLYYWMFFLKNCGYINIICNSSTIAHFTAEKVKATPFLRPKLSEQGKIVDIIKKQTDRIDRVTDSIQESVEKLKEYREALITVAVTGQIDVREEKTEFKL